MVVLEINVSNLTVPPSEGDSVVSGDHHRVSALSIALQGVESSHARTVLQARDRIEMVEDEQRRTMEPGAQLSRSSSLEQVRQSLVAKTPNAHTTGPDDDRHP